MIRRGKATKYAGTSNETTSGHVTDICANRRNVAESIAGMKKNLRMVSAEERKLLKDHSILSGLIDNISRRCKTARYS